LNNITGKELVQYYDISFKVCASILDFDKNNKNILKNNKKFKKLLPLLDNWYNRLTDKEFDYWSDNPATKKTMSELKTRNLLVDIIYKHDNYKGIVDMNLNFADMCSEAGKRDKNFKKIFDFFTRNKEIASIFYDIDDISKRELIIELIINKIIPFTAIFIYFDPEKDVKENTEHFFKLLNKKVSRNNIQSALRRELKGIIAGRFFLYSLS
jgi:hypothetical protein